MNIRHKSPAPSAFNVWVRKSFGPLGVRAFRAMDYMEHMRRTWMPAYQARMGLSLANIGTTFRPHGMKTYYPTDCVPGSSTNPYMNARYSLVQQAPAGATLGASLNPSYTISSDSMCQVVPSATFVTPGARVPLGIMTDEPGNEVNTDGTPYGGAVQLLCMGAARSTYAIADQAIAAGVLLIPSSLVNGQVGPATGLAAGIYWCVGAAGSTSEGAATGIELYQALFPLGVDVIT